jgi:hypothetical protein
MTAVKYFTNVMQGAPQLTNSWGCLVDLLDACLVNGFNLKPITSISSANGIATVTIDGGHLYQVDQVLLISGAEQTEYIGEVRVLTVTGTTFSYAIAGNPATPATGDSMTVKAAPLGFEKVFSSTNKAVYRSKNVLSNRPYLRVDNDCAPAYNTAYAKKAKVGMAQDMTDIDTVVGAQAPFDPLAPNKNWHTSGEGEAVVDGWYKWYYAKCSYMYQWVGDTARAGIENYSRPWVLVGDDRGFYLFNEYGTTGGGNGRTGYCFTDFESFRQGDPYNTLLAASDFFTTANGATSWGDTNNWFNRSLDYTGKILMRDHTLLGGNQRVGLTSLNTNNGQTISGRATGIPFPNPVDYSLILHPTYLMQEGGKGLRGKLPGLMWVHNDYPLQDLDIVENVVGYAGRKFLMVKMGYENQGACAAMALDITGPWW